MIQTFRDLTVWQKAMDLAVSVYTTSEKLPKSEIYGLSSQIVERSFRSHRTSPKAKRLAAKAIPVT